MLKNPYGQVVFITGASSGMGRATAKLLLSHGFKVYGTSRKERPDLDETNGEGFIKMMKMDVLDIESIRETVRRVAGREGGIDILVNNAGMNYAGSIEDTSYEEARKIIDTDFLGAAMVVKYVLPYMRRQNRGLIINVSSVGGYQALAYQSYYSAAKFALEAFSEALHVEVRNFGINVCIVEPGDTKTGATDARLYAKETLINEAYKDEFKSSLEIIETWERNGKSPYLIASLIAKIIKKKNPPVRVPQYGYKLFYLMTRILPRKFELWLFSYVYTPGIKNMNVRRQKRKEMRAGK